MRIEFVEMDNDNVTEDSEEIKDEIQMFRRNGWETRQVFIPNRVG